MISTTPTPTTTASGTHLLRQWPFLIAGLLFGVLLIKSEAASWYRIQEMFRFQSVHMYGLIGSAVLTGLITTTLLRRSGLHALNGETIHVPAKEGPTRRYVLGGLIFGLGWGLAGVCPGPIFALLGSHLLPMLIVLTAALVGTWAYGAVQHRL
ncbi:DUF6691 family protein [Deinococcus sp. LM3]|uniref:DUF6691 family protein n=1 Tax=Deinococcus sp. LM3 TaxID=1938608 RepID=UPI0009933540|nr:DUF6691 family protein [Deinococcus sp. LM3]OOV13657.1 transporter [Deinococcus sp. LM3]